MKTLIKIGGSLLECVERRESLARQLFELSDPDRRVVVVHGGGKRLSRYLAGLDHKSEFRNGLRVTPPEIMDAVLRVLGGSVNRQLVSVMQAAGLRAVGLTGIDGGIVRATQMHPDLGLVGKVRDVDPSLLDDLVDQGYLPVVACIAGGDAGAIYNVNADQMAAACASGLQVDRLVFLTDVGGVLDGSGEVLSTLTVSEAQALIDSGVAVGGMEAKLRAAIEVVRGGGCSVSIMDGHKDGILRAALEGAESGTLLTAD